MGRFDAKNSTTLEGAVWLSVAVVFAADSFTPLGIAVWVFYLVPITIALFGWRPAAPVFVAAAATIFTVVGFFVDTPGISPAVALANRFFGIATIWVLGIVGRQFL